MTVTKSTAETIDLAVWPIFHRMTVAGIKVDREKLKALLADVEEMKDEQLALLQHYTGKSINPNSGPQVAEWMAGEGLTTKMTKTRTRCATDERSLMAYASNPVVGCILDYRGLDKLRAAFIEPVLEKSAVGGVVHPQWRLTRVKSGRAASENPNMMAFPSRDAVGKRVRDCFVAREGRVMFSADFSQIEPRVVAALSGDEKLIEIFKSERDLYTETAVDLFRLPSALEVDKKIHRLPAKVVTLGVLYGIGAEKLAEELVKWGAVDKDGVPFFDRDQCADLICRWFKIYPRVAEMVNRVGSTARAADGWVYTQAGRGRYLPALFVTGSRWPAAKVREEAQRQAFNHVIQGTAQEYMKEAMVRAVDASALWLPLLQIHDELIGEIPSMAVDVVKKIARSMQTFAGPVQLKVETSVAASWGGLK